MRITKEIINGLIGGLDYFHAFHKLQSIYGLTSVQAKAALDEILADARETSILVSGGTSQICERWT